MAEFRAGENIAIKVPLHRYTEMVAFYRDTLKLPVLRSGEDSTTFQFGPMRLWLDKVPHQSQADIWLELRTPDIDEAMSALAESGVPVRDELEPLGELRAHWVSDPAGTVLLIHEEER